MPCGLRTNHPQTSTAPGVTRSSEPVSHSDSSVQIPRSEMENFFDSRRLLNGPWQAFERDVARLLVANGFEDVRVVGGSGDKGADVLGVKGSELWVVQCKFVTNQYPSPTAVDEVVEASRFYEANRLVVAASRAFGPATFATVKKWASLGIKVELLPAATLMEMARRSPEYAPARREPRKY